MQREGDTVPVTRHLVRHGLYVKKRAQHIKLCLAFDDKAHVFIMRNTLARVMPTKVCIGQRVETPAIVPPVTRIVVRIGSKMAQCTQLGTPVHGPPMRGDVKQQHQTHGSHEHKTGGWLLVEGDHARCKKRHGPTRTKCMGPGYVYALHNQAAPSVCVYVGWVIQQSELLHLQVERRRGQRRHVSILRRPRREHCRRHFHQDPAARDRGACTVSAPSVIAKSFAWWPSTCGRSGQGGPRMGGHPGVERGSSNRLWRWSRAALAVTKPLATHIGNMCLLARLSTEFAQETVRMRCQPCHFFRDTLEFFLSKTHEFTSHAAMATVMNYEKNYNDEKALKKYFTSEAHNDHTRTTRSM